jgi:hypothetical protein
VARATRVARAMRAARAAGVARGAARATPVAGVAWEAARGEVRTARDRVRAGCAARAGSGVAVEVAALPIEAHRGPAEEGRPPRRRTREAPSAAHPKGAVARRDRVVMADR